MTFQQIIKVGLLITLSYLLVDNSNAQNLTSDSLIIATLDSVSNSPFHNPSEDLLPPKFNSYTLKNCYFVGQFDSNATRPYQGNIFLLSFRDNCTFIYETFYQPYNNSRIEFAIGTYKVSQDSIFLSYESLLQGKPDRIYLKPTLSVSWILPERPKYVLIERDRLLEPTERRLKKGMFYKAKNKAQFEIRNCK